jgi:hypothetical protein
MILENKENRDMRKSHLVVGAWPMLFRLDLIVEGIV